MLDRDARIAVLGAGASGLAVAHALGRAGYGSVTVLERNQRVGGKCRTFFHQQRSYELGAGALTPHYRNVRELMKEVGLRASSGTSGLFTDLDTDRSSFIPPPLRERSWWRLGAEWWSFRRALRGERHLLRPGLAGISAELQAPFSEWARLRRVEGPAALIEPWFTGFGYGYFDEVPAAYVLKYAALFGFPISELLEVGYQGLWEQVAAKLDVRLGVAVRRITRGAEVAIETDAGSLTFDALVATCPPEDLLGVLDAGDEERALFSRIRYNDYHVVAAEVEHPPNARYGFFHKHMRREHAGQILFWYRRWKDRDLVLYYALPPEGTPIEATAEVARATAARMGGRVTNLHTLHTWRYFPHVTTADMNDGFYQRLEALQGQRSTFYAGEIFNFSCVETVVAYARDLVARRIAV